MPQEASLLVLSPNTREVRVEREPPLGLQRTWNKADVRISNVSLYVCGLSIGVKKGFALIAGIALTALCQSMMQRTPPSRGHLLAACLVGYSTFLHAKYNDAWYVERAKTRKSVEKNE